MKQRCVSVHTLRVLPPLAPPCRGVCWAPWLGFSSPPSSRASAPHRDGSERRCVRGAQSRLGPLPARSERSLGPVLPLRPPAAIRRAVLPRDPGLLPGGLGQDGGVHREVDFDPAGPPPDPETVPRRVPPRRRRAGAPARSVHFCHSHRGLQIFHPTLNISAEPG